VNIRLSNPFRGCEPEVGMGIVSAMVSALALAAPAEAAPTITGACPTATAMDFTATIRVGRAKNLVTGTLVNFVQGGNAPGCVVVIFTGAINAGGASTSLGAVMDADSSPVHAQSGPTLLSSGNTREPVTGVYIFPAVSPGPHKMQMEIAPKGVPVNMWNRATIVYHTP
jgi:hypothetical protein